MTWLASGLAIRARAPGLAAIARAGVGGGRERGVIGVAAQVADLLLGPLDPALEPLDLAGQREQHLDARLAPRVADRLGLGAAHAPEVRRARRGACLCQPALPEPIPADQLNAYGFPPPPEADS
jgi:hypothetical protein